MQIALTSLVSGEKMEKKNIIQICSGKNNLGFQSFILLILAWHSAKMFLTSGWLDYDVNGYETFTWEYRRVKQVFGQPDACI